MCLASSGEAPQPTAFGARDVEALHFCVGARALGSLQAVSRSGVGFGLGFRGPGVVDLGKLADLLCVGTRLYGFEPKEAFWDVASMGWIISSS